MSAVPGENCLPLESILQSAPRKRPRQEFSFCGGSHSLRLTGRTRHTTRWLLQLPYPQNNRASGSYTVHCGPYWYASSLLRLSRGLERGSAIPRGGRLTQILESGSNRSTGHRNTEHTTRTTNEQRLTQVRAQRRAQDTTSHPTSQGHSHTHTSRPHREPSSSQASSSLKLPPPCLAPGRSQRRTGPEVARVRPACRA